MNAVDLLENQHDEVRHLFERFEGSKRLPEKQEIFLEIAARLVGHDAIEREIFYPACERALGKTEQVMEAIAEHGSLEFALFRADKARNKDSFEYLVKVLREIVEHHLEEEEGELLPKAARKMGSDMLERLGDKMQARFEEAMSQDFRRPLRRNLEQVLLGRAKTTPAKRTARAGTKRRAAGAGRGRAATARKGTSKRATGSKRGTAR